MSEGNYGNPGNEGTAPETSHHELHDKVHHDPVPYWKRAHHEWSFWIGLFLMLAAMAIYVLSDNLALLPTGRPMHAPPSAVQR